MCWKTILLILVLGFIISCGKNEDITTTFTDDSFDPVISTICGTITSEQGVPLTNVKISSGTLTRNSDENGFFLMENVVVNSNGQMIQFIGDGYWEETAFVLPHESQINCFEIVLKRKSKTSELNTKDGGDLLNNDYLIVSLQPGALLNEDGSEYQGSVFSSIEFKSSTIDNLNFFGVATAHSVSNESGFAEAHGTLLIDLSTPSGDRLFSKGGIFINMKHEKWNPLDLWRIDPSLQLWNHESIISIGRSIAIDDSGAYIFGQWFPRTQLQGLVKGASKHISNQKIEIRNSNALYKIQSTQNGYYSTYIPQSKQFVLKAVNECEEEVWVDNVFASNTTVSKNIDIDNTANLVSVSLGLLDCNNQPLKNGYLKINGNQKILPDREGNIKTTIITCDRDSILIKVINNKDKQKSNGFRLEIINSEIMPPDIKACDGQSGQYLWYSLDNVEAWVDAPIGGHDNNSLIIFADHPDFQNPSNFQDFVFSVDGISSGMYLSEHTESFIELKNGDQFYGKCLGDCNGLINVNIVSPGTSIGDVIMGTLNGEIKNPKTGATSTILAQFNVVRTF